MVYCIGLTGTIASGKTTVADIFAQMGVDVFNADTVSRDLTTNNQEIIRTIIEYFGSDVVLEKGQLDRRRLRDLIFANQSARRWLEELLHPLIRTRLKELVAASTTPYCVVEIPLLIDKNLYPYINKILVIKSSEETQVNRVMVRDQCSREQALAILFAQPHINVLVKTADDVLINDSGLAQLTYSVEQLHKKYLRVTSK